MKQFFYALLLFVCISIPTHSYASLIYFGEVFDPTSSDGKIQVIDSDGSGLQTLVNTGGGFRGIAMDPIGEKMYWTDVNNDIIFRANFDGTSQEEIVNSGLSFPRGIDIYNNKIFWGDAVAGKISSANLDGTGVSSIVPTTDFFNGLEVDSINDKLYWSVTVGSTQGHIMRSDLDGTNIETIISNVGKPSAIALDAAAGKIYWTDHVDDVVRRGNVDGSGVEDLYVVGSNLNPDGIALDLVEGKIYWGQSYDSNRDNIMRMNLDGSNSEIFASGFGLVADIEIIQVSGQQAVPEPTTMLLLGTGLICLAGARRRMNK